MSRIGHRQLAEIRAQLSERDQAIVADLARWRMLTTAQVQRLHFPLERHTPLWAARLSRRVLARLEGHQILVRLARRIGGVRAGSGATVWTLGEVGRRLLNLDVPRRRVHEPSAYFMDHTLAVAETYVSLVDAQLSGLLEVLDVQAEPACWRDFTGPSGVVTLKPDLHVTLGVGEDELHWFIEVDRDTEHLPTIVRKADLYLAYARSGVEQHRVGVFPRVLWITPEQRRATDITERLTRATAAPAELFVAATEHTALAVLGGAEPPTNSSI